MENLLMDRVLLREDFGDKKKILIEVIGTFRTELPKLMSDVEEAIQVGGYKSIEKTAHTLKGAIAVFHAAKLTENIFQLETMMRQSRSILKDAIPKWAEIKAFLAILDIELDQVIEEAKN